MAKFLDIPLNSTFYRKGRLAVKKSIMTFVYIDAPAEGEHYDDGQSEAITQTVAEHTAAQQPENQPDTLETLSVKVKELKATVVALQSEVKDIQVAAKKSKAKKQLRAPKKSVAKKAASKKVTKKARR
jgi:hypothetical protein